jgi:RNA polymerase sigma factor (sigma-70 family)
MARDAESFSELFAQAREGDRGAWEMVFERLANEDAEGAGILEMARRILPRGDRARDFVESRDLMQSALKSGWFNAEDFRGNTQAELLAWIRMILRRKLGRVVRRKTPRPAGGDLPESDHDSRRDDPESPLAGLLREEVKAKVRAAVKGLPEDQRVVMELRLDGLQTPDIAGMLGLSAEAVRKRESRAAAQLRKDFGAGEG